MNRPWLHRDDIAAVQRSLESGWVASGPAVDEFERRWAAYCGRRHGVAVCNGTVALEVALQGLGIAAGDEVILPAFTIISCVRAVLRAGAVPVLVDGDPRNWTMDVSEVERRITPRTRAIMAVHIYGHPVDMDPLLAVAAARGVAVLEDAAEAHGAEYGGRRGHWRRCGGFGDASCFSFYANKLVTTGEGGMVLTDDDALADRLRALRNLGFGAAHRFEHDLIGHNYRLSNLQAALGVSQVDRMSDIIARKRGIAARYTAALARHDDLHLPAEEPWARSVFWVYGLVTDESGIDAAELARRLRHRGVETRPFFRPMHQQPALRRLGLFAADSHPVAERIGRRGLYLPSGLGVRDDEQQRVIDAVIESLAP